MPSALLKSLLINQPPFAVRAESRLPSLLLYQHVNPKVAGSFLVAKLNLARDAIFRPFIGGALLWCRWP
jgi:hypothetical protein